MGVHFTDLQNQKTYLAPGLMAFYIRSFDGFHKCITTKEIVVRSVQFMDIETVHSNITWPNIVHIFRQALMCEGRL